MRYASIDIGTNTILMLVGEIDGTLSVRPIKDFYSVPRIGKSVSATKRLDEESISRALRVLGEYRTEAERLGVERIFASATSAVRDAVNRDEFIDSVRRICGISVEVIPGELEAKLGFLGAVSGNPDPSRSSLVIDIGGGSTEFSFGTGTEPQRLASINVGAVRVTELFFKHNPPSPDELLAATRFVEENLKDFPFSEIKPDRVFAVAGTATTIAMISSGKYRFDAALVNNYKMPTDKLREVFGMLRTKSPAEIRKLTDAADGREDVLLAGALILLKAVEAAGATEFITTDRGLRYGYLIFKHAGIPGQ
jgi:exopolyphosphatase / guanosine-5'-triphosphate,3'-diphosphate pyrophosphatase